MRKAAARATGLSHTFSPRSKAAAGLRVFGNALAAGTPQSPLPEDAAVATSTGYGLLGESRDGSSAERGAEEEAAPDARFGSERSDADDGRASPAAGATAADAGKTTAIPEEEKVWVLGYRVDVLYRFS